VNTIATVVIAVIDLNLKTFSITMLAKGTDFIGYKF
jgi:hypothetical protein